MLQKIWDLKFASMVSSFSGQSLPLFGVWKGGGVSRPKINKVRHEGKGSRQKVNKCDIGEEGQQFWMAPNLYLKNDLREAHLEIFLKIENNFNKIQARFLPKTKNNEAQIKTTGSYIKKCIHFHIPLILHSSDDSIMSIHLKTLRKAYRKNSITCI